ncbi:MAG TPA: RND transporter, partial [Burkholderiaceae bacterium]
YRAGTASYLAVLTAQQASLASQRTAMELRGRQLAAGVGLVVATGAGWSAADRPQPSAAAAQEPTP